MSREFTLFLAIIILDVLLGALCLAVARSERGSPALRFWGWGLLGCALGFLLILIESAVPLRIADLFLATLGPAGDTLRGRFLLRLVFHRTGALTLRPALS
jgi:hypothetical protein